MPRHGGGLGGSGRRHHQSKRGRLRSRYHKRLAARDYRGKSRPSMPSLDALREWQGPADAERMMAALGVKDRGGNEQQRTGEHFANYSDQRRDKRRAAANDRAAPAR